jgi:hypothetical protein
MCKNCGNCAFEHSMRTIDDAVDVVLDNPFNPTKPGIGR